jgi:hypothetical protein
VPCTESLSPDGLTPNSDISSFLEWTVLYQESLTTKTEVLDLDLDKHMYNDKENIHSIN